tara:strand:- start:4802 stop:5278 length:477 start_codon:yes stop_codon:yes gene_type:complete
MKNIFLVFLLLLSFNGLSQSVISSAGSSKSAGDYIVSWTIGEGVISTIGNNNIELTQGFHQPLLVDVLPTGIEKELQLEMRAFPNPTFDRVMFEGGDPVGIYHVRVVDKLGRVLEQKSVNSADLVIEMQKFNNGTYLVEVVEEDTGKRKIFNIIKSIK